MTEAEWQASEDPLAMIDSRHLAGRQRKARLFACTSVRQVLHLTPHDWVRQTVEAAERFIDGRLSRRKAAEAYTAMQDGFRRINESRTIENHAEPGINATLAVVGAAAPMGPDGHATDRPRQRPFSTREVREVVCYALDAAPMEAWRLRHLAGHIETPPAGQASEPALRRALAGLLRDLLGPLPFRPVVLAPGWLTPTVVSLAEAAYEERQLPSGELDRHRLLVLADALEEAGCTDTDLLGHLREQGPHARGCWVVDLILNKE